MKINCRTNLDNVRTAEHWPTVLPERPVIGDLIQSTTSWPGNVHLELRVVSTTWKLIPYLVANRYSEANPDNWYLKVELSIPYAIESIADFQRRYEKIRNGL